MKDMNGNRFIKMSVSILICCIVATHSTGVPNSNSFNAAAMTEESAETVVNLRGDINSDGILTMIDVVELQKHLLNIETSTELLLGNADLNEDGNTNIFDLVILKQKMVTLQSNIIGNPDPPKITSENRSLHKLLLMEEDTSYDAIFVKVKEEAYSIDSEVISCIITNANIGKGFYYYEIPYIEQKKGDQWVRLFNNSERIGVAQWLFCGTVDNTTIPNSCQVNIELSNVEPTITAGRYRFVIFTPENTLYAEFDIVE